MANSIPLACYSQPPRDWRTLCGDRQRTRNAVNSTKSGAKSLLRQDRHRTGQTGTGQEVD